MPAIPGTVVARGSLITPAGDQGPPGVPGASGPTAVSTLAGNKARLGPDSLIYVPPDPFADNTQGGLLRQLSGSTTDFVDGTNSCQPLAPAVQPMIWAVRQRSFNALGNPNFEVDQRTAGNGLTGMTANAYIQDRWQWGQTPSVTGRCKAQQQGVTPAPGLVIPGSNYVITTKAFAVTLTGAQASLGFADAVYLYQQVEGCRFRQMAGSGHSLGLLVKCSSALSFAVFIRDASNTHSLTLLCRIAAANTWTVIPLPNLASWPSAGTFNNSPGSIGYTIGICLAAGSGYMPPINEPIWQSGNFLGAAGQTNFLDLASNSVFQVGFIQHEPGLYCSSFLDVDFETNLDSCQRYYQQSCPYGLLPTATNQPAGVFKGTTFANVYAVGQIAFKRSMATIPTVLGYSAFTGLVNKLYDTTYAVDRNITGPQKVGDSGFSGFTTVSVPTGEWEWNAHWTADTGM